MHRRHYKSRDYSTEDIRQILIRCQSSCSHSYELEGVFSGDGTDVHRRVMEMGYTPLYLVVRSLNDETHSQIAYYRTIDRLMFLEPLEELPRYLHLLENPVYGAIIRYRLETGR